MSKIIGVSGKIGSGKDTIGEIIRYLKLRDYYSVSELRDNGWPVDFTPNMDIPYIPEQFQIKKFADKLKDCVCLLIGCTRKELEDHTFKDAPLGPEWNLFRTTSSYGGPDEINISSKGWVHEYKERLTPRRILQLLGTDAGRNIIHPNIWVNASFADYKSEQVMKPAVAIGGGKYEIQDKNKYHGKIISCANYSYEVYPNWLFTDVRFPNEFDAIKSRGGIVIRVNRDDGSRMIDTNPHESETALDDYGGSFDYNIHNVGTIEELVGQVKVILKHAKII